MTREGAGKARGAWSYGGGFGGHSCEDRGLTLGIVATCRLRRTKAFAGQLSKFGQTSEIVMTRGRPRHLATVIFWIALVWVPGLVLMAYLLLPLRHH
jgi:hypothetical protein